MRDNILAGTFHPGTRLPSSRVLAQDLAVSRNTVVLAYEWLTNEGYIECRPGAGTFVTTRLPETFLAAAGAFKAIPRGPTTEVSRPRVVFRGERHTVVEKGANRPAIDFWYGSPNWRHFPLKAWRQLLIDNTSRASANLSEYGGPSGNLELRKAISENIGATRGIRATPEQIVITAGAQEGMNLVCRLFVETGVRVAVENPCYAGAARVFASYGADLIPIEVDDDGIDVGALEKQRASLAYITPSHQFPTGATLSLDRRLRLLKWATTVGAYIIEDDYDSDFRYDSPPLTALTGLARNSCVIYLGTFSKSIGAGLRMGFVVVPEHLVDEITRVKSLLSYGHPWLDQIVLAEFIKSGGYGQHLRKIQRLYQHSRDALVSNLKRHFGDLRISGENAGMHLMWTLPSRLGMARDFAAKAERFNVGIYPLDTVGAVDFKGTRQANSIVLGYSALTIEQIKAGVERLSRAADGVRGGPDPARAPRNSVAMPI
jgi:GntR family transcriptional regulator / MocR family aminotransferase